MYKNTDHTSSYQLFLVVNTREIKACLHRNPGMNSCAIHSSEDWKEPGCPSTNGQINEKWPIHITEYYSVIKRKEVCFHTLAQIDRNNIKLKK